MSGLTVRQSPTGVRFAVRVQPGARAPARRRGWTGGVDGVHGDALKVRLAAPPVDGAANEALVALLAEALGVRPGAVRIVHGATGRTKVIEVDGLEAASVRRLASAP